MGLSAGHLFSLELHNFCPEIEVGVDISGETAALYGAPNQTSVLGVVTGWFFNGNRLNSDRLVSDS